MHFPMTEISNGGRIMVLAKEESSKDDGNKKARKRRGTSCFTTMLLKDSHPGELFIADDE